jgi:hypothetical protein
MRRFTLKPEHVALLRRGNVGWNSDESGAPGLDPKRPYGNSDVPRDVAEILGAKPIGGWDSEAWEVYLDAHRDRLVNLHHETETALAVVLAAGSFEPGNYEADDYRDNWRRV